MGTIVSSGMTFALVMAMAAVRTAASPLISRPLLTIVTVIVPFMSSVTGWHGAWLSVLNGVLVWNDVVALGSPLLNSGRVALWLHAPPLYTDALSAHLLLTVNACYAAVMCYTATAQRSDPQMPQLVRLLSGFTGSFVLLISAASGLWLLVGWELVGIYSYWLIGYHRRRTEAITSANKAVLVNRISDAVHIWVLVWLWQSTGSLEIAALRSVPGFLGVAVSIACAGKSAGLLLHGWLGDAMEGPTPVSALMHAATLVTAGIYLAIRLGPNASLLGALTALVTGLLGLTSRDVKKVIAASTGSQMGLAFALHPGHLLPHAAYKAALFLAAGVVILGIPQQHTARYGGYRNGDRLLVCTLCLSGWPALSGFAPKETILSLAAAAVPLALPAGVYGLLFASAMLTSCYGTARFQQWVVADVDYASLRLAS